MTLTIGHLRIDGANAVALQEAMSKAGGVHGIIFGGASGSGKTTTATALMGDRGYLVRCYDPEQVARLEDWRGWILPDRWVLLDDLGRDAVRNEYGNKSDTVGRFVRGLYDAWRGGEWTGRLYVTTNLSGAEMRQSYDESITSRLAEMCVPCKFTENHRVRAGNGGGIGQPVRAGAWPADEGGGYKWGLYADHGIDTSSELFHAAMFAASDAGLVGNSLRVMLCNLRAITPDEAEVIRCVYGRAGSQVMGTYMRDAIVYAYCASDAEREAFFSGLKAYARAAFDASVVAQAAYSSDNVRAFAGWTKTFDIAPWYSVNEVLRSAPPVPDEAGKKHASPPPPDWNAAAKVAAGARFGWEAGADKEEGAA